MNLPFTFGASVMSGALFPAFSRVQSEPHKLRRAFVVATELTAMVAATACGLLAIAAPHVIPMLYGENWRDVVAPLQVLCIAGYFRALYHLGGVVAHSVGAVYAELRNQVIYAGLVLGGAMIGASRGLVGVAAGVGCAILWMFVATSRLALRASALTWREYLHGQLGAMVTAIFSCAFGLGVRLALERQEVSSPIISAAVVCAGGVP